MNKKLALLLACCAASGLIACNETVEWGYVEQCTENELRCDTDKIMVCNSEGGWDLKQACQTPTPVCDAATKQCVAGVTCTDGTFNCNGNTPVKCESNTWKQQSACGADQVCNATNGNCDPKQATTCTEGQTKCDDNGNLMTCGADGEWPATGEACGNGNVCGAGADGKMACINNVKPECEAEQTKCSDDANGIVSCVDGKWDTANAKACEGDTPKCAVDADKAVACAANEGCTAGEIKCSPDGKGTQTCGDDKNFGDAVACPDTQLCGDLEDGKKGCVEEAKTECTKKDGTKVAVGVAYCGADNKLITCQKDGTFDDGVVCEGETPVCRDAACSAYKTCDAVAHDALTCAEDKVQKCNDGKLELAEDCTKNEPAQVCDNTGHKCITPEDSDCMDPVIKDGEKACIGAKLYTCTDGDAKSEDCTTDVKNAVPICDATDNTQCGWKCAEGYVKTDDKTGCECKVNICDDTNANNVTIRTCLGFGLSDPDPCSTKITDTNAATFGCNTAKDACVIKTCKEGFELNTEGTACVSKVVGCEFEGKPIDDDTAFCKDETHPATCNAGVINGMPACQANEKCDPEAMATKYCVAETPTTCTGTETKCSNDDTTKIGQKYTCTDGTWGAAVSCTNVSCKDKVCGDCLNGTTKCEDQTKGSKLSTCKNGAMDAGTVDETKSCISETEVGVCLNGAKQCKDAHNLQTCASGAWGEDLSVPCADGVQVECVVDTDCTEDPAKTKCDTDTHTCKATAPVAYKVVDGCAFMAVNGTKAYGRVKVTGSGETDVTKYAGRIVCKSKTATGNDPKVTTVWSVNASATKNDACKAGSESTTCGHAQALGDNVEFVADLDGKTADTYACVYEFQVNSGDWYVCGNNATTWATPVVESSLTDASSMTNEITVAATPTTAEYFSIDFSNDCESPKCTTTNTGTSATYDEVRTYNFDGGVKLIAKGNFHDSKGQMVLTANKNKPSSIEVTGLSGIGDISFDYKVYNKNDNAPQKLELKDDTIVKEFDFSAMNTDEEGNHKEVFNTDAVKFTIAHPAGTSTTNNSGRIIIKNLKITKK